MNCSAMHHSFPYDAAECMPARWADSELVRKAPRAVVIAHALPHLFKPALLAKVTRLNAFVFDKSNNSVCNSHRQWLSQSDADDCAGVS